MLLLLSTVYGEKTSNNIYDNRILIFFYLSMAVILFYVGLSVILTFFIYRWIPRYFALRKMLKNIPGPKNIPFIGFAWKVRKIPVEDKFKWITELYLSFKNGMVVTWFGTEPLISIRKPSQMEELLSSHTLISKSKFYDNLKLLIGDGLAVSTGEKWIRDRRLITPAFHFSILKEYTTVMREKVKVFCDCVETEIRVNSEGKVNIFELAANFAFDTICETAIGVNVDTQRHSDSTEYNKAFVTFARLSAERQMNPLFKFNVVYYRTESGKQFQNAIRIMHDFTKKIITKKTIERHNMRPKVTEKTDEFGLRNRKAFLDLLLDECEKQEHPLTFKELQDQVVTFISGGYETTASSIAWTLFALGNAPEIQEKVHEELKEIFGDNDEVANTEQLAQLKYLDRVIKESLRMYPSIPRVSRCLDIDTQIDGYLLPKGNTVSMEIYQLHHDPEIWKDPETFDPDRFLPENRRRRDPYDYVPFSAGPRNCIGQKFALLELKTALTAVLRKWRVRSALKPTEIKMLVNFTIRPYKEKIELYFFPL